MKKNIDLSLYFIADQALAHGRHLETIVNQAILGGVSAIQVRGKELSSRELTELARRIMSVGSKHGIPVIINDRVDVALAVNAQGVHLGQDDIPLLAARKILGTRKIIGISVHTIEEARKAEMGGADYAGVGTVFRTSSKKNIRGLIGIGGLSRLRSAVKIPVVAIGGIDAANARRIMETGVDGIAVLSAIMNSGDPKRTCKQITRIIRSANKTPST